MPGLRLNLGAGGRTDPDWTHVDLVASAPEQMAFDMREPWPWGESTVDGIALHHVLCMLTDDECWNVLLKCHRALKLGACVRVSDADLVWAIHRAIARDEAWFPTPTRERFEETVGFFITQGGARKQFLTEKRMMALLAQAGFSHVYESQFQRTLGPDWLTDLDDRESESWFVEAIR